MKRLEIAYKKIVVKIGSSVLVSGTEAVDEAGLKEIVSDVCRLYDRNISVIIVSSGAIASGMSLLGITTRPRQISNLQAVASIGQIELMSLYSRLFKEKGRFCCQVLLTWEDFDNRDRYINAKNTLLESIKYNSIPIINENDTVSTEEIKFGDNDRLSALVANLIDAQLLVILSDVDGLYRNNKKDVIRVVEHIDRDIERMACGTDKVACVGGMSSKLEASRIVTETGTPCIIANGRTAGILNKIVDNDYLGTLFLPKSKVLAARKRWIAFGTKPKGKILVDKGAKLALKEKNKSLLYVGIIGLVGDFAKGDIVIIADSDNSEFARGIVNYSIDELKKMKQDPRTVKEVIHRDNLVII